MFCEIVIILNIIQNVYAHKLSSAFSYHQFFSTSSKPITSPLFAHNSQVKRNYFIYYIDIKMRTPFLTYMLNNIALYTYKQESVARV